MIGRSVYINYWVLITSVFSVLAKTGGRGRKGKEREGKEKRSTVDSETVRCATRASFSGLSIVLRVFSLPVIYSLNILECLLYAHRHAHIHTDTHLLRPSLKVTL